MEVSCRGDIDVDDHHTVEDVGIVLGQAFAEAIYPVGSIERYGNSTVVMDEASVSCDLDISNRPFLIFELPIDGKVGTFDVELVEEFFRAFTFNAKITLHLIFNRGRNRHHIIEASFKALAVAIRRGLNINSKGRDGERGDLYLLFNVEHDELFIRDGVDIYIEVPVFFTQTILGDTIKIPSLEGEIDLELRVGTDDREQFIFEDKGVIDIRAIRGR